MQRFSVKISNQRGIINRRAISDSINILTKEQGEKARQPIVELLQKSLQEGRAEISRRLIHKPSAGNEAAASQAFLVDQLVRLIYDYVTQHRYRNSNPSASERISLLAVGGYGRGEMAPHSDVDIAFITPYKRTSWTEQIIEAMLYILWDLGLKIGQSSRSIDESIKLAREDLTIKTALLESRFIWGDRDVYEESRTRFWTDVVHNTTPQFISDKMEERDKRHKQMGDSRYVVEPNIKEGKGGLRDLHALFWIGKYVHRVKKAAELVDVGLFTTTEYRKFKRAENFLWAVRCHMHDIAGRLEDRLTFDLQREVAQRMNFADRAGQSSVERFMQYYFLNAKTVGDLTGLFLAHVDETLAKKGRRFLPYITRRPKKLNGFKLDRGRLSLPDDDFFAQDPIRMIEIFHLADKYNLEIHPLAMRAARKNSKLIDKNIRNDKKANALFLKILTSKNNPENVLRWMNEATIFGRFIPDFGRVVAQMQFDMYHHYTVDEHTIRAIGLLSKIERGEKKEDHPLASAITKRIASRNVLYVATLLHDIAKGRGGDHSILGAEIALKLCPRLGLTNAETQLVSWLVRHHLLLSANAFKRDLSDYQTILQFSQTVKSIERLRLLLVLTVVDIRAVGPGVWNSWKRQLLTDCFEASEEILRLGYKHKGRKERIIARRQSVLEISQLSEEDFTQIADKMRDSYWIAEPEDIIARNIKAIHQNSDKDLAIDIIYYPDRGATLVSVFATDHPGLFYRLAGAIHLAGGNIIDAHVHTNRDGLAIDNFLIQDPFMQPFQEENQFVRLRRAIEDALANKSKMNIKLDAKPLALQRANSFDIAPSVFFDDAASNRFTVVEVNARDRPALLNNLAYALFQSKTVVHSAHIATYGERAVDTFYLTDLLGAKITSKQRLTSLEKKLIAAAKIDDIDEKKVA